jgi:hypothetical protein
VFLVYILLNTPVHVTFVVLILFLCVPYVFRMCSFCAAYVRPAQYSVFLCVMRLFDSACGCAWVCECACMGVYGCVSVRVWVCMGV